MIDRNAVKQRLVGHPRAYQSVARLHRVLRYLRRVPHEREFAFFATLPDRGGLFLDIGANYGTSAMSFRLFNKRSRILSIEPNPIHERDLRLVKRLVPRFQYMICAAGERNGHGTLYVPFYRCIPVTGEASLMPDVGRAESSWFLRQLTVASPEEYRIQEVPVEIRRLDDLGLTPDIVKIDVEGAELSVLKGLGETIRRCQPIMLIEASAVAAIDEHLRLLDYRIFGLDASTDRLVPFREGSFANVFCIPRGISSPVFGSARSGWGVDLGDAGLKQG